MSIPWLVTTGNGLALNLSRLSLARNYATQAASAISSRRKTDQQERAIRRTEQLKRARRRGEDQPLSDTTREDQSPQRYAAHSNSRPGQGDDDSMADLVTGDRRPQRYASAGNLSSRDGYRGSSMSSSNSDSSMRERRYELSAKLKELRERIKGRKEFGDAASIYEDAQQLVVKTRGLGNSSLIYNQLIDLAFLAGKKSEAIGLFDEMKKRGICPNMTNYSTLLGGLVRSDVHPDRESALFARVETIMQDIDRIRREAFPPRSTGDTTLPFSETLDDDKSDRPRRRRDDDDDDADDDGNFPQAKRLHERRRRELIASVRANPLDLTVPYCHFARLMLRARRPDAAWSVISQFSHQWQPTKDGFPRLTGSSLDRLMGTWFMPDDPPLTADDAEKIAQVWKAYKDLLYESCPVVLLEWQTARGPDAKARTLQEWQSTIASTNYALSGLLNIAGITRLPLVCDTAIEMLSFLTDLNIMPERKAEEMSKLPEEARDPNHPFYMLQSFGIAPPPDQAPDHSGRFRSIRVRNMLLSNVCRQLAPAHYSSSYSKSPIFYDMFIAVADAALLQSREHQTAAAASPRAKNRSHHFDDVSSMTEEEQDRQEMNVLKQQLPVARAVNDLHNLPRSEAEGRAIRLMGTTRRLYLEGLSDRPPASRVYYKAMALLQNHRIVNTQLGKWWLEDRRHDRRQVEEPWNVWSIYSSNFCTSNLCKTIRTGQAAFGATSNDQGNSSSSETVATKKPETDDDSEDASMKLTEAESADVAAAAMRLHGDDGIDDTIPSLAVMRKRAQAVELEVEADVHTEERRLYARSISLDFLKQWRASFGLPLKGSTTIADDSLFPRPSDLEGVVLDTAGLFGEHRHSVLFRLTDLCTDLSTITRRALDTGRQGSDFLPESEVTWIKAFRRRVLEVRERAEELLEEEERKPENKGKTSTLLAPPEGEYGRSKSVRERKAERYARGPIRGGTDRHRVIRDLEAKPRRKQSDGMHL